MTPTSTGTAHRARRVRKARSVRAAMRPPHRARPAPLRNTGTAMDAEHVQPGQQARETGLYVHAMSTSTGPDRLARYAHWARSVREATPHRHRARHAILMSTGTDRLAKHAQ